MISDIFISNLQQLSCLAVTYGPTNECHLPFLCSATTRISCQHFHGAVWCLQNLNLFLGPGCSFSSRINYVLFSSRWERVFALTAVFWLSACNRTSYKPGAKAQIIITIQLSTSESDELSTINENSFLEGWTTALIGQFEYQPCEGSWI